jgi:hypothetical protein
MADWIDKWKQDTEKHREDERRKEELRLQADRAIRAKLPDLMVPLFENVTQDAAKLKEVFPADPGRHCDVAMKGEELVIRSASSPYRQARVSLNINVHRIEIEKCTDLDSLGNPERPFREYIEVGVNSVDGTTLTFINRDHTETYCTPADLSEYLVKFVCGRSS